MRAGKNNFAEVAVYAAIIGVLLGWRVVQFRKKKRGAATAPSRGALSGR
jgi:sulfoxide reductase heme-binding subunit YedZ